MTNIANVSSYDTGYKRYKHDATRGHWSSKWDFLAVCLGHSFGINHFSMMSYALVSFGGSKSSDCQHHNFYTTNNEFDFCFLSVCVYYSTVRCTVFYLYVHLLNTNTRHTTPKFTAYIPF